jgi:two-component system, OmpR family, response regulator
MTQPNGPILIVDDEPDAGWALEHVLGKLGIHSEQALTGEAALERIRCHAYSLVFLDAKLPDIDGLNLARRIRAAHPGLPIVLVSGYFFKDDATMMAAVAEGLIEEFIGKPFLHEQILRAVTGAQSGAHA